MTTIISLHNLVYLVIAINLFAISCIAKKKDQDRQFKPVELDSTSYDRLKWPWRLNLRNFPETMLVLAFLVFKNMLDLLLWASLNIFLANFHTVLATRISITISTSVPITITFCISIIHCEQC